MDLESIGKKMLEALAVQGQIAAAEAKLANLSEQLAKADGGISDLKNKRVNAAQDKGLAEDVLAKAINESEAARVRSIEAAKILKATKLAVASAEGKVAEYGEGVFASLDDSVKQLEESKQAIEMDKGATAEEVKVLMEDLVARQAELGAEGIVLNISQPASQPKTTYL